MAEYMSERELRLKERHRRKEDEEERIKLKELERELIEKHEKEMRDLRLQQERIRKEKCDKLKRRREMLEKEFMLEKMKEQERMVLDTFKLPEQETSITQRKESERITFNKSINGSMVDDNGHGDDSNTSDVENEHSDDDILYSTLDELKFDDSGTFIEVGQPNDASSFIDSYHEKLRDIDKEIQWLHNKNECTTLNTTKNTFEEWKLEVEVIIDSDMYDENVLRQAVEKFSSWSNKKNIINNTLQLQQGKIISKLENVYGMYESESEEGITEWGIRLETIVQKAIEKGHVSESQKDEMLKTRFWRQLKSEQLKNATRMYFETAKSFEELRKKVRLEEYEMFRQDDKKTTRTETKETLIIKEEWRDRDRERTDKQYYREKEETQRKTESNTNEKRMDLNSKASLSGGR
ncbi:golgin subfamily A member 6-like protein 22 [Ruditapes philippinarum]|uniref:golgin subfamily A member 6-like protein 22 n=1 Tax=Ruditapes philippinarum TaxID=129788 RepID=UPI00295BE349|nr:golgin subfamily A member 6-like protein 22 [Ruditapes philippinarum]